MRRQIRFEYRTPVEGHRPLGVIHTRQEGLPDPVLRRYRPGSGALTGIIGGEAPEFDDEILSGNKEVQPWKMLKMRSLEEQVL
jgi:hypothetical protein